MALMLYLPDEKPATERLLQVIAHCVPGEDIEICRSVQALSERLRKPVFDVCAAVLFVASGEDLAKILMFHDFLWNLRVITILPDSEAHMIAKAHLLRPRYVTWDDDNFESVGIILKRLVEFRHKEQSDMAK